jgi:hypothetical protein
LKLLPNTTTKDRQITKITTRKDLKSEATKKIAEGMAQRIET